MVKLLVEEGGLVEPGIPWTRHRGRSRSWGSEGGRLDSTRRRVSRALPYGRWGFGNDGPNEYDEVRNMGTWGVSGRIWQMRVRICNGPKLMPRGCPYIGVLPSTLTLCDSYSASHDS